MLYLLVMRPSMISPIEGMRKIKYQEAYEEAMYFINSRDVRSNESACEELLSLSSEMPIRSKFVLCDACFLIKSLNDLTVIKKWEIIRKVWVKMFSYAASHCRGKYHAESLIRGGELFTHIWFLMTQMGLGQQYRLCVYLCWCKTRCNIATVSCSSRFSCLALEIFCK